MGEYRHSMDAKNRISVPARFREQLGEQIVVTKGYDGSLAIYTMEKWAELVARIQKLPQTNRQVRQYVRALTAKATECGYDAQGRIQIPAYLKDEAKIDKRCVFVGMAGYVELWSEEEYDSYEAETAGSFDEAAEALTEFLNGTL